MNSPKAFDDDFFTSPFDDDDFYTYTSSFDDDFVNDGGFPLWLLIATDVAIGVAAMIITWCARKYCCLSTEPENTLPISIPQSTATVQHSKPGNTT